LVNATGVPVLRTRYGGSAVFWEPHLLHSAAGAGFWGSRPKSGISPRFPQR
jgi:hypothetical protein